MTERTSLNVVDDQIGSPTYAADLAQVILNIIESPIFHSGIYHYSNDGEISWYQFAKEIKKISAFSCDLIGIPTSSYPTLAKRPSFSLLETSKIQNVYCINPINYKVSLEKMIGRFLIDKKKF